MSHLLFSLALYRIAGTLLRVGVAEHLSLYEVWRPQNIKIAFMNTNHNHNSNHDRNGVVVGIARAGPLQISLADSNRRARRRRAYI